MKKLTLLLVLLAFSTSLVGCGGSNGPKQVYTQFMDAVKAKDGEKSWNCLSKSTQAMFDSSFSMIKSLGTTDPAAAAEYANVKDGKGFWVKMISEGKTDKDPLKDVMQTTPLDEVINGDTGYLNVKYRESTEKIPFVKENGAWKMDLSAI